MKKNSTGVTWGILLILAGIAMGGKLLGWFNIDLFFDGWWSLFVIIPSSIRFFTETGERVQALRNLALGVLLLLAAQGFIEWSMFFPLLIAVMFIAMGMRMMTGGKKPRKPERSEYYFDEDYNYDEDITGPDTQYNPDWERTTRSDTERNRNFNAEYESAGYRYQSSRKAENTYRYSQNRTYGAQGTYSSRNQYTQHTQDTVREGRCGCTAIFTGREIRYRQERFNGAALSAIMGAIDLNLVEAVIDHDVVIDATVLMGGLDIIVPNHARVVVNCTPIMGGIENHVAQPERSGVTIYVNAFCVMGGIDIHNEASYKRKR